MILRVQAGTDLLVCCLYQHLRPYKLKAPPPCAPGYGGAFCKIELGTGGDYVDEVASRLWSYAFASDARY